MSDFNLTTAIKRTAESVKHSTLCPDHGVHPTYEFVITTKGANVKWNFCCDKLREKIEKKFADECTNHIIDTITKSIVNMIK